jgi:hypothetical protein
MGRIKRITFYVLIWDKRLSAFNCLINIIRIKSECLCTYNNIADGDNNVDNVKETVTQMEGSRDSAVGIATV